MKTRSQWLEALRSGKYKQGRLRHEDKFCCLGVLIEDELTFSKGAWRGKYCINYLSSEQLERAGFSAEVQETLSRLNDAGCTFEEIADWIENELQ